MIFEIEGYQNFEEVKESIKKLGKVIGESDSLEPTILKIRITSMRSLLDLLEKYANS